MHLNNPCARHAHLGRNLCRLLLAGQLADQSVSLRGRVISVGNRVACNSHRSAQVAAVTLP